MNKNISDIVKSIPMKNVTLFMALLVLGLLFLGREGIANRFSGQNLAQVAGSTYPTKTYKLTVNTVGKGSVGLSTGSSIGSNSSKTYTFNKGSSVYLVATRSTTTYFKQWSGACSGNSITCTVTMDSDKTVSANFNSTDNVCKRESIDSARERILNNGNISPEQRQQQMQNLDDSLIYFGCTW